jgi:iron complex transport system substrate-binding protein
MRVVSLLPSATDTVIALGEGQNLVGRTHEVGVSPFVAKGTLSLLR